MIAEELRIGNWIHDPKHNKCDFQIEMFMGAHDFQAVTKDFLEDLTLKLDQCEPIPLTEEWLERLGFNGCWLETKGGDIDMSGVLTAKNIASIGGEDSCTNGSCYHAEINYVHQLQNLVFALTGEELTIKEVEK